MIYFFLLASIILTSGLCNKKFKIEERSLLGKDVYTFFWCIILIFLVAYRSVNIGNDTHQYEYIFNSMKSFDSYFSWLSVNTYTSGTEHGYYLLCFFISRFANYRFFLIITAILTISPVMYLIWRYSPTISMSLILYICFPYYTFTMSGLRQSYALALIAIAYIFSIEKKLIKFIATILLATTFHTSAFLFLPIYWISKLKNTKKTRLVAVVAIVVCFILRNQIWQIATLFARQQYDSNNAGGMGMCIFLVISVLLGIYYRKSFVNGIYEESNKVLFYLQVLAAMIAPLALVNSAISRIYFYYHIFFILYVPILIKSISKRSEKWIITFVYTVVAVYFLISIVMNPIQHYYPYFFMWQ